MNLPTTVMEAIIYILQCVGCIFFLVGLAAFMPIVFTYSLALGLVYLGIVMVLVGSILDRI